MPIKSVKTPVISPENPKDLWSASLNLEANGEWESGDVALTVAYDGRMRVADAYQFRLASSPVATLRFGQHVPLQLAIERFVEPFRRIISVATGESQDLTYVTVELEGGSNKYQVFGTGIDQSPFESSSKVVRKKRSVRDNYERRKAAHMSKREELLRIAQEKARL